MVIAVISDTHLPRGARRIPDACVARMRESDLVIHAGDIATREVLEQIEETAAKPVVAVHGNVDSAELRNALPESRVVDADGAKIAVVHDAGPATGRLTRMRKRFPDARAVVFGHSHIPLLERDERDGFQIFNPGSPTDRRRQPQHTMGMARAADGEVTFTLHQLD
jgi:putative phosphoesterase